jgi:glycosyltransferase involved in cell wall biosynthesis
MSETAAPASLELSIVMPCLNEELTIGACIRDAQRFLTDHGIAGEIIIADNGSTDRSAAIAAELSARVIEVKQKGYGNALKGGIEAARGRYIIMGDADQSYDFTALMPFVEKLRQGYDLVMGNRFAGGIQPGAMPWHHRYLGNPVLSFVGRLFFKTPVRDFHCGLRGFSKVAVDQMALQTSGMEFASEMVIKSSLLEMKVFEVPTTLSPDGRDRPPHLRSWRDGWRHLRFMLIYSPKWLFFIPGIVLMVIGLALSLAIYITPLSISGVYLDINTMLYAGVMLILGFQSIFASLFSWTFGFHNRLFEANNLVRWLHRHFRLELGLIIGLVLFLGGILIGVRVFLDWSAAGFGNLDPAIFTRQAILSAWLILLGSSTVLGSFLLSIFQTNLEHRR